MYGRNISDAIRGLYDTIDTANNRELKGILMTIDFSKAFDSIAFAFIEAVLRLFKFSNNLIAWIMMLKSFTIVILHTGNISE